MPALDALTAKQLAYEGMHTAYWHQWVDGFTASLRGEARETLPMGIDYHEKGGEFTKRMDRTLNNAHSFYVAPEMNALVTAAAEDWPHDEPVEKEDFPTAWGWMWVPGGITSIDVRGQLIPTVALSWEQTGGGVDVTFWADKVNDPPHIKEQPGWEPMTKYSPWHIVRIPYGDTLPLAVRMGKILPPEVSREIQWMKTGPSGYSVYIPEGYSAADLTPVESPEPVVAWLVSALRIMQQPLADVRKQGVPAALRKSIDRKPVRISQKAVTVIEYRQRKGEFATGTGREFSHRFLRRGHWRRQPYKRDDGTWDRRRIWIHPQIVGDPSKPLILREHVSALLR